MIDKKIVIGIIIFIVGGMLIYSFANPLETNNSNEKESNNVEELEDVDKEDNEEINNEVVEEENTATEEETKTKTVIKYVTVPTSGGSSSNTNNGTTPTPQPVVRSSKTQFSLGKEESSGIKVIESGSTITYSGTMNKKLKLTIDGVEYVNYVYVVLSAPEAISQTEFDNVKFVWCGIEVGKDDGYFHYDSVTGQAYLIYPQEFKPNDVDNITNIPIKIYWGYGEEKSYNLSFPIIVNDI